MREIKFRAWDRKRKKMWYPFNDEVDFYAIGMSGALYALDENGKYDYTEEFEKMIFMQFTGLKDSNGKEIYEGDIIKFYENNPEKWVDVTSTAILVKWDYYFMCLSISHEGVLFPIGEGIEVVKRDGFNYYKVIGNIHENPELLKEVENG
jgi:uncharacterized phage protein (TIGR01671 family)